MQVEVQRADAPPGNAVLLGDDRPWRLVSLALQLGVDWLGYKQLLRGREAGRWMLFAMLGGAIDLYGSYVVLFFSIGLLFINARPRAQKISVRSGAAKRRLALFARRD
jgi:hypothetical protein